MLNTSQTINNDYWIEVLGIKRDRVPILIIGNNPIEMTSIYNTLIEIRSKNYLADVCFDIKDSFDRIAKTKPEVVFIDDNLILHDLKKLVRILKQNARTKHIKIIVLKSSNWNYHIIDNVDDYILKDAINATILDRLIEKNLNPLKPQLA
jgi:PleD family two-component response regulator